MTNLTTMPELWRRALERDYDERTNVPDSLHAAVHSMWEEIERLRERVNELTAKLLEVGGELGKVQEHNRSLRESLRRQESVEPTD